MQTLVLNSAYVPIGMVNWKKAIKKVIKEKADLLEIYEDKHLNTFRDAFDMPAVIRLLHFIRPPKSVRWFKPFTRKNVYERDEGKCQYCGKELTLSKMTFDHVIPRVQGGHTCWENIVTACVKCNTKKAGKTPLEAKMKLLKKIVAPRIETTPERCFMERLQSLENFPHESWKNYVYWNVELKE